MKYEEALVVHGTGHRRIRPSNWIERLMEIVAAHFRERMESQPCATCCQCTDTQCFVFPVDLHRTQPGLVQDLLFCLRMLEAPDLSARCPRNMIGSELERKTAA
jgi:hypothetical protein